jgi:hypothetical protein
MCQIIYIDRIEIVNPLLNSRKTTGRKHEHHYRYMDKEERERLGVKSTGIGTWICKCGKITHSM